MSQVPEGMRPDARETWPSHDLIESWLGDAMYDFQLRPGEDVVIDADDVRQRLESLAKDEDLSRFIL